MINYQTPTIGLGTDVSFSLKLRFNGSTVTIYSSGETISRDMSERDVDLTQIDELSVRLRPHLSKQEIIPAYHLDIEGGRLVIEFPASRQRLGDWSAVVRFTLPSTEQTDRRTQYMATIPLCYVEDSAQILQQRQHIEIDATVWSALRGPAGTGARGPVGPQGDTPRIVDGYWWIGDVNTGVLAEAQRISAADWLLLNKLTAHKAITSHWEYAYDWGETITPDKILDDYRGKRVSGIEGLIIAKGSQNFPNWKKIAMVIDDVQRYGDQLIVSAEWWARNNGTLSIYWLGAEDRWEAASVARIDHDINQRSKLTAQIDNAHGPLIIIAEVGHEGYNIYTLDIFSPSGEHVATPQGTWLARNKAPQKGDTYLCTNIGTRGERILLAWDGHNWLTAWGATIRGETTNEAKQAYTEAILALRRSILEIPQ